MAEEIKRVQAAKNFYEVLGVAPTEADEQIKKAYRRQALRLHPDKTKAEHAEEAFKAVSEAFNVLSDSRKRARYDELLRSGGDGRSTAFDFGEFGAEDEGRGDTTVVEAWCQLSLSDFIAFCLQRGPVRLLINVAAVAYVVLLLSKSLFFDILCPTTAKRFCFCTLVGLGCLMLSVNHESFGMKVLVACLTGLIVLTLYANGKVMCAMGSSIFGVAFVYFEWGLVVSLLACLVGWLLIGLFLPPLLPSKMKADNNGSGSGNGSASAAPNPPQARPAAAAAPEAKKRGGKKKGRDR